MLSERRANSKTTTTLVGSSTRYITRRPLDRSRQKSVPESFTTTLRARLDRQGQDRFCGSAPDHRAVGVEAGVERPEPDLDATPPSVTPRLVRRWPSFRRPTTRRRSRPTLRHHGGILGERRVGGKRGPRALPRPPASAASASSTMSLHAAIRPRCLHLDRSIAVGVEIDRHLHRTTLPECWVPAHSAATRSGTVRP